MAIITCGISVIIYICVWEQVFRIVLKEKALYEKETIKHPDHVCPGDRIDPGFCLCIFRKT